MESREKAEGRPGKAGATRVARADTALTRTGSEGGVSGPTAWLYQVGGVITQIAVDGSSPTATYQCGMLDE
ncbi:hypothetical protein GCM10009577_68980 [Streptomyces javensis]